MAACKSGQCNFRSFNRYCVLTIQVSDTGPELQDSNVPPSDQRGNAALNASSYSCSNTTKEK